MDRQPHRKQNPEFFEPLKIFFAILIVSLVFFAPIVQSEKEGTPTTLQEYPAFHPFASSADACPWNCIKCTSWDQNAWPRTCLTYECTDASGNCGDPGDGGGGGPSYQPPTISHVLNCSNTGNNGWCIGTLNLDLTAADPQGQTVVISGTVNGDAFACPSGQTTCSIPLPEAVGTATYKVDSATGLSANGSTSYHLDVTTPQISGDINGSSGTNGWYISQTSVTASASDALSGLASFEVNVDSAGWASYNDTTFTDGTHTIQFRATDNAGNVTETALQSVNVDTTAPTLDLSTTGTTGSNGWYVSAVTLTPTASDATSGLYSLEATTDGVTWFSMNAPVTLNDGIYTVQFRAVDQAGNISQTPSQQIKVDATTPSLSLNINGTRGQNDWYISSVTVMPNASDVGSGVNKIEASVNNGAWGTITSPLSFTDGVHSYKIRVTDNAGNFTETPILPMMVDTVPPAIAIYDDSLNLGDTLMYDLEDMMSGLWINRSVIEDEDEKYKKIVWLEEIAGKKSNDNEIRWDGVFADGTKAAPGQYFITLKISDQAGNETMRTAIVEVTAFNSILPIPAFTPPASIVTEPIPSEASTTNEQSFGGANNGNAGTETTTTNGETVFASVNLQAGGTNSFTSGNQTTSSPISDPNILWGAAAAAMLGATLAEWQKKREEEAARLAALIASNAGQGDEDEIPPDVLARRRGKVIAKNQAKRAQEQAWEAVRTQQLAQQQAKIAKVLQADMTEDEKLAVYKQTPEYVARQEAIKEYERQKAMKAQRAGERNAVSIAEEYKAREREKAMGGGKPLAVPAIQTSDWRINYQREYALEMHRIGEQNPNFTLGDIMATLALRKYRVNDPNFFRFDFDNDNWGGIDFPGQSNCSNFLSQIWWQAGIRFPPQGDQIWDGQYLQRMPEGIFLFTNNKQNHDNLQTWYKTPEQQKLFSKYHGEFRIVYENIAASPNALRNNLSFGEIVDRYPQIFQNGSAVFYYDRFYGDWAHTGIIVRQSLPSTNLLYPDSPVVGNRPAIVEQDGRFDYVFDEDGTIIGRNPSPNRQIRSIDDTTNQNLTQISVVPVSEIKPDLYDLDTSTMQVVPTNDGKTCFVVDQGGQGEYSLLYCPASPSGVTP